MDDCIPGSSAIRRSSRPSRLGTRHAHLREPLFSPSKSGDNNDLDRSALYRTLGAHLTTVDGARGTHFAVWAPNATGVSVLCDANDWKPNINTLWGSNAGIWSGFIPDLGEGTAYKFSVRTSWGEYLEKSDPFAFYCEKSPKTASIVYNHSQYDWQDGDWIAERESRHLFDQPISTYEVHLGSWKRPKDGRPFFNYRELAEQLVEYCRQIGYNFLQLMPITEFPFDGSWGYQTTGYFAPTSRYGTPDDFKYFVDYCHQNGVGVLIDWVPAHFPTDGHSLGRFDGTSIYEHSDPRQGFHPDWGTYIFNYGRHEVCDFLLSSAHFWMKMFHLDGLRVDAVASMLYLDYSREEGEWIPNAYGGRENLDAIEFLKNMNTRLHGDFPGILTIAEESTAWGGVSHPVDSGGLGFSMKWDMGWMNDTLGYMAEEPVHRAYHQNDLSFRMIYAFTENFVLPLSHDEVVHGKKSLLAQMPGDHWQQFANLRLLYGYQYAMPGKKLLFMGGEFAQWTEWNHNIELDWALFGHKYHDGIRRYLGDLNRIYRDEPSLHEVDFDERGFAWIQADDWQNSVFAFLRFARNRDDSLAIICNFTPVPRDGYRVGVPRAGFYHEILNSDAEIYGGGNVGNRGGLTTEPVAAHGHAQSLVVTLPPLSTVILKPE